jgi:dTDP-glucose 4,6-dehydratase
MDRNIIKQNLTSVKTILVTGGAGFIGTNFILFLTKYYDVKIINYDVLTYASNINNLISIHGDNYVFIKGDVRDQNLFLDTLLKYDVDAVINFAAESHVDYSIKNPQVFLETNILGVFQTLEASRKFLAVNKTKNNFRFLHVSTDEVFGSLDSNDPAFTESSLYQPNSPYSASKAASDHLVRAWFHTYGMPVITTNCSNNYGPYQFKEKLIPLIISNALSLKKLPIYGDGLNIRDWLYVEDHCSAIFNVLLNGCIGESYNIGGNNEKTNLDVVKTICQQLDEYYPVKNNHYYENIKHQKIKSYLDLVEFVEDRKGHDRRYAINSSKIKEELQWKPKESFETGMNKTLIWYLSEFKKNLELTTFDNL